MQPDMLVINGKMRLSLTEVLTLDEPEWLETPINTSPAVSNALIQKLYSLFAFKDDTSAKEYGVGVEGLWGIYRKVQKKFKGEGYQRDQATIFIFISPKKYAKLFISPVRESKNSVLEEMERMRNIPHLLKQLGPLDALTIETIPLRQSKPHKQQKPIKPATSRPFSNLDELTHLKEDRDSSNEQTDKLVLEGDLLSALKDATAPQNTSEDT